MLFRLLLMLLFDESVGLENPYALRPLLAFGTVSNQKARFH